MLTPAILSLSEDPTSPDVLANVEDRLKAELTCLGLTTNEARIYIHLASTGALKARDVSDALGIHRTETYHLLTSLQNKGLVNATFQHPIKFSAVTFSRALTVLMEIQRQQLLSVERKKPYLFQLWKALPRVEGEEDGEKEGFQILEGANQIYIRAGEMVEKSRQQLQVAAGENDLIRLYQSGFFDRVKSSCRRRVIPQILTRKSERIKGVLDDVGRVEVYYAPQNMEYLPHFILADNGELLFFVRSGDTPRREISALWTNYAAFAQTMQLFFAGFRGLTPRVVA